MGSATFALVKCADQAASTSTERALATECYFDINCCQLAICYSRLDPKLQFCGFLHGSRQFSGLSRSPEGGAGRRPGEQEKAPQTPGICGA